MPLARFHSSDAEIAFTDVGGGPPILFVHGWGMHHALWRPQFNVLGSSFRLIAVDLRGHGESSRPAGGFDYASHAADLCALAHALGLRNATIVGSSFGGAVAVTAAVAAPELFARVVTVGTPPKLLRADGFAWGGTMESADAFVAALERDPAAALADVLRNSVYEAPDPTLRDLLAGQLHAMDLPSGIAQHRAVAAEDLRELVGRLAQPLLVVQGSHDSFVPMEAAEWMAAHAPDARLERFERSGHLPNVEEPERFNDVLAAFATFS